MKNKLLISVTILAIILAAVSCTKPAVSASAPKPEASSSSSGPNAAALNGLSAKEALALANTWKGSDKVTTFVDQHQVNFSFVSGKIVSVALPENEMVVAIAPYFQNTHPCKVHYMSGCQGELVNLPFKVTATDADGKLVIEDTYTSMSNGFIELWLPRDLELTVAISGGGKAAESVIGTYTNSNTCITTIKLT